MSELQAWTNDHQIPWQCRRRADRLAWAARPEYRRPAWCPVRLVGSDVVGERHRPGPV